VEARLALAIARFANRAAQIGGLPTHTVLGTRKNIEMDG